jgi:hypothetical protein
LKKNRVNIQTLNLNCRDSRMLLFSLVSQKLSQQKELFGFPFYILLLTIMRLIANECCFKGKEPLF